MASVEPRCDRRTPLLALALAVLLAGRPAGGAEGLGDAERARLRACAAATWGSLAAMARPNGLPADGLHRAPDGAMAPAAHTSPTDIAAYLWSVLGAEALGLIGPQEAADRIGRTLTTLEGMERSRGFFYNWYDADSARPLSAWPTDGAPIDPYLSSVDNGWLAAALILVGNAEPGARARAEALLRPMDFGFFYDAYDPADPAGHPGLFRVGYRPDVGAYTGAHYGLLNTEARIISYVAIARGQVPPEHYYRLRRTLPPEVAQHQAPRGELRDHGGIPVFQGHYTCGRQRLVPSWGGSMFEALMVTLLVPEAQWAPASWGVNHPAYVRAQIDFGRRRGGRGLWGLSPASRPAGGYAEYGVPGLGSRPGGYPPGDDRGSHVVTPHASFLALPFAPAEAQANLAALAGRFPIYGPLGFYDAVDVGTGRVAESVLALDQGMVLGAIANALADGVLWRQFSAGRVEAALRPLLASERFTAGPAAPAAADGLRLLLGRLRPGRAPGAVPRRLPD